MKTATYFFAFFLLTLSCQKEGCTYPNAINYNPKATKDDNSCQFPPEETPTPTTVYTKCQVFEMDLLNVSGLVDNMTNSVKFQISDSINGAIYFNNTTYLYNYNLPATSIVGGNSSLITNLNRTLRFEVLVQNVSKGIFYFKPTQNGQMHQTLQFENLNTNLVVEVPIQFQL